jgi:hypothetical protein
VCLQWDPSPISGDAADQSVFNLVQLAGSWRVLAELDDHIVLVSKTLKLKFPTSIAMAIASTSIRSDQ